jgi:glucose-1-phosphate adenylyltransferase
VGYGDDNTPNAELPNALNTGLTVVGKGAHLPQGIRLGRNVVVQPFRQENDFPSLVIQSGQTV